MFLKRVQTLPWVWSWSRLNCRPWAFSEMSNVFNTLLAWHWVSFQRIYMYRKIIIKTSPEHLMFVWKCQARFGLVVNEFSKLEHIRISNPGDSFQNTSPAVWSATIGRSVFHENLNLSNAWHEYMYDSSYFSTQRSKFLYKYQIFLRELDENSWKLNVRITDCWVSCSFPSSLKTFTDCNEVLTHSV